MVRPNTGSGLTTVRMPIDLHQVLIKTADEQRVSLNTLMVSLLAGGVGFKLPEDGSK